VITIGLLWGACTHVDYEEENFSGRMGIFRKLKIYEWQREFRLAIFRDLKRPNSRPITLNIGNIEKLCIIAETSDLKKMELNTANRAIWPMVKNRI
jgi:hypothetical protein